MTIADPAHRRFLLADVFTDHPFGGNQLAVLPAAAGLSPDQMQRLAREFNFPETTFVSEPVSAASTHRVRIFTPQAEVPFAGHPTLGTAAVLTYLLRDGNTHDRRFSFDEGIGALAVATEDYGNAITASLCLPVPIIETAPAPPRAEAAAALSLGESAVIGAAFGSVGLRFCLIELRDADAVDRAVLDLGAWRAHFAERWSPNLFFYTERSDDFYARMFAPALGIAEDPATGSAAAALAALRALAHPDTDGEFSWHISQGVRLGRPSQIEVAAVKSGGRVTEIRLRGSTVVVASGDILVPVETW